jgi:hypothetical protein
VPKQKKVDQYQPLRRAIPEPKSDSRDLLETPSNGELGRLSQANDVLAMVNLALPGIHKLARRMATGEHHDPETARRTKKSLNGLLDTIERVCHGHQVRFADALAYLYPVEDLLIALSLAAGDHGDDTDPSSGSEGQQ